MRLGIIITCFFCFSLWAQESKEILVKSLQIKDAKKRKWQLQVYFNPTLTQYLNSNVKIQSSQMSGELFNAQIQQRHYFQQFNPQNAKNFLDFLKFFEEPTNKLGLELQYKDDYAVGLVYFHPKITFLEKDMINKNIRFKGNFQGQKIDDYINLSDFLTQFRLTGGFTNLEIYADKITRVMSYPGGGHIDLRTGLGIGMYIGYSYVAYKIPDTEEKLISTKKLTPIGVSTTLRNQLLYVFPKENFSINTSINLSAGYLKYQFADGYASHNNMNMQFSFGVSWKFLK